MAEYPGNGPGGEAKGIDDIDLASRLDSAKEMAENAKERAEQALQDARDLVLRYPAWAVMGAAAAGFFFARFVARRR